MIDQFHSLLRDVYAYLSLGPDDSITIAPGTDLLIAVICLILVLLILIAALVYFILRKKRDGKDDAGKLVCRF